MPDAFVPEALPHMGSVLLLAVPVVVLAVGPAAQQKLRIAPAGPAPFALRNSREAKLKKFFPALADLNCEAPQTCRSPAAGNFLP